MSDFNVWSYVAKMGVQVRPTSDPYFDEGNKLSKIDKPVFLVAQDIEEFLHRDFPKFSCQQPGCQAKFQQLHECESHYNSVHRHSCSVCHRSLPSSHLLDLHIAENHDSFFSVLSEKKPMYQCFLPTCLDFSWTSEERRDHAIKQHKFPHDFRFDDARKKSRKKVSKLEKPKEKRISCITTDSNEPKAWKEMSNKKNAMEVDCVDYESSKVKGGECETKIVKIGESDAKKVSDGERETKIVKVGDSETVVVMRKHVSCVERRPLSLARMGERRSVCMDSSPSPSGPSAAPSSMTSRLSRSPFHGTAPDVSKTYDEAPLVVKNTRKSKIPVRSNSCRVPNNCSFGAGVPRAFQRPRSKNWYQVKSSPMDTTTDINKTDFSLLRNSLPGT